MILLYGISVRDSSFLDEQGDDNADKYRSEQTVEKLAERDVDGTQL